MGAGIAEVLARAGLSVTAVDVNDAAVARGREHIEQSTDRAVVRGKLDAAERDAILGRIRFGTSLEDLAQAELVVEAEDLGEHRGVVEDEAADQGPERAEPDAELREHEVEREDQDQQRDRAEELDERRQDHAHPAVLREPADREHQTEQGGEDHADDRYLQGPQQGLAECLRHLAGGVEQDGPALRLQLTVAGQAEQRERDDHDDDEGADRRADAEAPAGLRAEQVEQDRCRHRTIATLRSIRLTARADGTVMTM
jgi:hypothetical protein